MNKPILFASISAIVLLSSIQIAFATLDCYKQGALDGHRLAFNDTTSAHCGPAVYSRIQSTRISLN